MSILKQSEANPSDGARQAMQSHEPKPGHNLFAGQHFLMANNASPPITGLFFPLYWTTVQQQRFLSSGIKSDGPFYSVPMR